MSGTEWTEPGKGATWREILDAPSVDTETARRLRRVEDANPSLWRKRTRTNLNLTGAPLTAEDIKRIEQVQTLR